MAQGKPSGRAGEKREFCEGDRGNGKPPCKRPAGWGTDHPGIGYCKFHGGSTTTHQMAAIPTMAAGFANRVAVPEMSPRETLLWMISETTDEAAYYTLMIRLLDDGQVWGFQESFVDRPQKQEGGGESASSRVQEIRTSEPRAHIWIELRAKAYDRLAKFIKMAEDIGIAEREIALAERHGAQIADAIGTILEGLGLTDAQRKLAPAIVEGAIRQLEAPSGSLAA
jgi:hypothetical protein